MTEHNALRRDVKSIQPDLSDDMVDSVVASLWNDMITSPESGDVACAVRSTEAFQRAEAAARA